MQYRKNVEKYIDWERKAQWGMANYKEIKVLSSQRKPIPPDLALARRDHMVALINQGAPKTWVARLYKISRTQLYRILSTP